MNIETYFKILNFITQKTIKLDKLVLIAKQKDLAQELNIPIATFKRYFKMLNEQGLIAKESKGMYVISPKSFKVLDNIKEEFKFE